MHTRERMRMKDLKGKCKTRLSIRRMNFMLGPYFHIDMIWIEWSYIVCIALLKATNALLKVSTKISKFPHSRALMETCRLAYSKCIVKSQVITHEQGWLKLNKNVLKLENPSKKFVSAIDFNVKIELTQSSKCIKK